MNKPIFKNSNVQGVAQKGGGVLKLRFDCYIMKFLLFTICNFFSGYITY